MLANSNGGSKQEHANNELLKRASHTQSLTHESKRMNTQQGAGQAFTRSPV